MVLTTRILQTASLTPKVCTGTFKSSGFTFEEKQGGVGWGRIYTKITLDPDQNSMYLNNFNENLNFN